MKIDIFCSDPLHPVIDVMKNLDCFYPHNIHSFNFKSDLEELNGGDFLFLVSCSIFIPKIVREKYKFSLVLHASDLPKGRGWSPYIWEVINGSSQITVSLIEASDIIDSGNIWLKKVFYLEGHELLDEIHDKLFKCEIDLIVDAIENYSFIQPKKQSIENKTYFPKRTPKDSEINPDLSISQQFNLLRVADSDRFPSFFKFKGYTYKINIKKVN
jgi:methionyl-tRNA formyltransferase